MSTNGNSSDRVPSIGIEHAPEARVGGVWADEYPQKEYDYDKVLKVIEEKIREYVYTPEVSGNFLDFSIPDKKLVALTPVTQLPVSPYPGQTILWTGSQFGPTTICWQFTYQPSVDATYPWIFVGGPELHEEVTTDESTTSLNYASLTTIGPQIVLPFEGIYNVKIAANLYSVTGGQAWMSYNFGLDSAVDADSIVYASTSTGAYQFRGRQKTATVSPCTITMQYKGDISGTAHFSARQLWVHPVKVKATNV